MVAFEFLIATIIYLPSILKIVDIGEKRAEFIGNLMTMVIDIGTIAAYVSRKINKDSLTKNNSIVKVEAIINIAPKQTVLRLF